MIKTEKNEVPPVEVSYPYVPPCDRCFLLIRLVHCGFELG